MPFSEKLLLKTRAVMQVGVDFKSTHIWPEDEAPSCLTHFFSDSHFTSESLKRNVKLS